MGKTLTTIYTGKYVAQRKCRDSACWLTLCCGPKPAVTCMSTCVSHGEQDGVGEKKISRQGLIQFFCRIVYFSYIYFKNPFQKQENNKK